MRTILKTLVILIVFVAAATYIGDYYAHRLDQGTSIKPTPQPCPYVGSDNHCIPSEVHDTGDYHHTASQSVIDLGEVCPDAGSGETYDNECLQNAVRNSHVGSITTTGKCSPVIIGNHSTVTNNCGEIKK